MPGSTLAAQGKRLPDGQARGALSMFTATSSRLFEGTHEIDNPNDIRAERALLIAELDVQVSEHVRLDFVIPYTFAEFHTVVGGNPTEFDRSGLSDVSGTLVWTPWGDGLDLEEFLSPWNVSFAFGVKAPNGRVSNDGTNDTPAKLGSGSTDFTFGAAYCGRLSRDWELFASAFVTLNGPEREPETATGQRVVNGDLWRTRLGTTVRALPWLTASVSVDAEVRGRNRLDDVVLPQSGGTIWSVTPGLSVDIGAGAWLFAGVSVPVRRDVNNSQLVSNETWTFGVSWLF
ncbi:MAG: hypothetical protein HYY16_00080 [Planctomycetes bacterium]|nr:hypothetical protein [Planctomycetota bacterium]